MKILLAYSSKTKNTYKVAKAIYEQIKNFANVDLINIKKAKTKLSMYDFYILGCWTDKGTANKNMMNFIETQNIRQKNVAIFMTCGVPVEHYHAKDSINNFTQYMTNLNNNILGSFICQGKIDPKILIVFKFLTWRDPNFIHKIDQTMLEWVEISKPHPTKTDLLNAQNWIKSLLEKHY
ncbi:flavodoxin [Gemella sp. GH3]|uniref:flavodoxin family protein n=1 Tax=unclassified Gemella TaxID=2624949 RepID=UPI0015D0B9C8|nr:MULTISPECIES: flavodoxin family protein [unclassified Gemella]MBF0713675.1 flavodoxin [Gemella sp. GH3.1]NYS50627.1 flavodoxin [Gemella sp. GH3]